MTHRNLTEPQKGAAHTSPGTSRTPQMKLSLKREHRFCKSTGTPRVHAKVTPKPECPSHKY